jgi:ParB family chromosome partitioning protein
MPVKKGGLGRGLDSLFEENGGLDEQAAASAVKLRIMDVEPNRDQPRRDFDEAALAELSRSIAEHGVLQPILVRPVPGGAYQIIAGERRWRAAQTAGLSEIPVVIREFTDEQAMAAALIENLQREDLNPMEEAAGYQKLMDAFGLTQEEVSRRLGKSRPAVANALRLLKLPLPIKDMVRAGKLSSGHARALLGVENPAMIFPLTEEVMAGDFSVRETERRVKRHNEAWKRTDKEEGARPAARRASFFDEVQLSLSQAMGRKIQVVTKGKAEEGTLVIDFYSREDLQGIAQSLSGE